MIAFRSMLVNPAKKAKIKVPPDVNTYNKEEYPHWHVYCNLQIGRRMPNGSAHWDNAKIIASIPIDKIITLSFKEIIALGFQ